MKEEERGTPHKDKRREGFKSFPIGNEQRRQSQGSESDQR